MIRGVIQYDVKLNYSKEALGLNCIAFETKKWLCNFTHLFRLGRMKLLLYDLILWALLTKTFILWSYPFRNWELSRG